jgi:preprotein translocase subunit SecD
MNKVILIISIILVSFSEINAQAQSGLKQDTLKEYKGVDKRQTGFFLVAAEADIAAALPVVGAEQQVVLYDYKFLRKFERGKIRYFLLPKIADVPLILATTPELQEKGENGFPELRLELTNEAANKLEKLTREHLGGKVVFMIDGEPVTFSKIRSVIRGGQFRLSRCTDTACQYIYGRLMEKK